MLKAAAILLAIVGAVAFLFGYSIKEAAQSAIHELEYLTCFLIGVVGFGTAAIVWGLADLVEMKRAEQRARMAPVSPPPPLHAPDLGKALGDLERKS